MGQAFASRSLLLCSFPWSLLTGQPPRVHVGQGQGGSMAAHGQCLVQGCDMLLLAQSLSVLLVPWAAQDSCTTVLSFHPLRDSSWGSTLPGPSACQHPLSLHLHLEPGEKAPSCQPIYHQLPQHGNMEKCALSLGRSPRTTGPEE